MLNKFNQSNTMNQITKLYNTSSLRLSVFVARIELICTGHICLHWSMPVMSWIHHQRQTQKYSAKAETTNKYCKMSLTQTGITVPSVANNIVTVRSWFVFETNRKPLWR